MQALYFFPLYKPSAVCSLFSSHHSSSRKSKKSNLLLIFYTTNTKMIAKITAVIALIAAATAAPVGRSIMGKLPTGTGFSAMGTTTAGASADEDSGVAGASLDGTGSVLGLAGPGLALGAAIKSPEM